ncbi:hypothetical protein [Burkholderia sp. BCC1998]|uniref:hypothetical protein n=1 Tax=Burkholderia sp. BCC1998 TaxID=2817447 RepID=UPI002AB74BC5|nr:hypothetical protein [Burkholderia sp. BCC1998]
MAVRRLEDIQREAIGARSRLSIQRWETMQFDVQLRMASLKNLIGSAESDEIHRHVVVALIAALQTYFRGTIVAITDSGDDYRERAAERITEKISMKDALTWFSGKSVTFGELVAHVASCNSATDVMSWLGSLLNCNFRDALASSVSEYDQRNGKVDPPLIVSDVEKLLSELSETFRLRHILAHEAATSLQIDADACRTMWNAVQTLLRGTNAVLWATVYKKLPLTQAEMTKHAYADVLEARKELAEILRHARNLACRDGASAWLRATHFAWMKVMADWYRNTYWKLQGSMWPAVSEADRAAAIRSRVKQISQWVRWQQPERP